MNALQRDLKRLVPMVEAAGAARVADPHRQKLHVQPPVGWLNDPNGLCQIGDEYHVFYQYGPFDPTGGVKHWGHVRSRDLFHWERLPVMLYPDEPFDCHGVYSGSALVEDVMRPKALPPRMAAASSLAGWACRMPITPTPPWSMAGSTA